jgi:hypothetical protein
MKLYCRPRGRHKVQDRIMIMTIINSLKPSAKYTYHLHHSAFCPQIVFGFCMILRVNISYFLKQHEPTDLCNGEVLCHLHDTDYIIKYLDELQFKWLKIFETD